MSALTTHPSPIDVLNSLVVPEQPISEELATYLLQLRFTPEAISRVSDLSRKAQTASLTDSEDRELDQFIFVGDLIAILQSRARQRLNNAGGTSAA